MTLTDIEQASEEASDNVVASAKNTGEILMGLMVIMYSTLMC